MDDTTATLRGLTIGAGTNYRWAEWPSGLLSTPGIRVGDVSLSQADGLVPGQDLLGGRLVVFDLWVLGQTRAEGEANASLLAAAFAPSSVNLPLQVRVTGSPSEYLMTGRPRGVEFALSSQFISGKTRARAVFMATDPRRYSTSLQTATTGLATSSGGLLFSAAAPFVFGSGGGGATMSVPNNGTFKTTWTATFTGPLVAPALTLVGTGERVLLSGATLAAGETLVVDSAARTVKLNGTASRYNWLQSDTAWFDLAPGANSVNLTGASGAGSVLLSWRSAWL